MVRLREAALPGWFHFNSLIDGNMFGLGFSEILLILVVALLVFGPERMPEVARTLGRALGQFRRAADEFRYEISTSHFDHEPVRDRRPGSQPIINTESDAAAVPAEKSGVAAQAEAVGATPSPSADQTKNS